MSAPPGAIRLLADPDPAFRAALAEAMLAFSDAAAGPADRQPLAVTVDLPGAPPIGLWGRTGHAWLFVEILFVPAPWRGQGLGARLLAAAEAEALRRGCHAAWLDTMTDGARRFYERRGYRQFAQLEDHPPGHRRVFLRKRLGSAIGENRPT